MLFLSHWARRPAGIAFALMALMQIQIRELGAQAADRPVHFWEAPTSQIDLDKLTSDNLASAEIRLLATPPFGDMDFATFRASGTVAPVDYVAPGELTRPYLTRGEVDFELIAEGLQIGASPYTDRKYKVTELPVALQGLTLLQMKMGHKGIVDARYAVILSADKPCLVFLAIDQRTIGVYREVGVPSWLEEFSPTGLQIRTDDPIMAQVDGRYAVFVKPIAGGRIALGPQGTPPNSTSMYFAFFAHARFSRNISSEAALQDGSADRPLPER